MLKDPWLKRWIPALQRSAAGSVLLEIGCGAGQDTKTLLAHGFKVTAFDLSEKEVAKARVAAPAASISTQSVLDKFPLEGSGIGVVIASLSLHYFAWQETVSLISRIHSTLRPGGLLLARFNSSEDINFGATGHRSIEPGLFFVNGQPKRFFTEENINTLFGGDGWDLKNVEHFVTYKYILPKALWEVAVERAA